MVSGAASLVRVRHQLFVALDEADAALAHCQGEPDDEYSPQRATARLQQLRDILNQVELTGAELLVQEIQDQLVRMTAGARAQSTECMPALSNALQVLRHYLVEVDVHRQEIPELLLPAINDVRQACQLPLLPESFFFSVRLEQHCPASPPLGLAEITRQSEGKRLRLIYQIGLLGFIREQDIAAKLSLMRRAMGRLDRLLAGQDNARLCWHCAAALEACADGQLLPRKSRKQLFSRIDAEIRQMLTESGYEPPRSLIKELLYLLALSDGQGPLACEVRALYGITALPFTDHLLEEEFQRISGSGQALMRSRCSALHEELDIARNLLDKVARGALEQEGFVRLHALLAKVGKALAMVGLGFAGNTLAALLPTVRAWREGATAQQDDLLKLANEVLYVATELSLLERDERIQASRTGSETALFAQQQLVEARIVVLDESRLGLEQARRALATYAESAGDRMQMSAVPSSLQAVRAGLWFLDLEPVASLVAACAQYVRAQILDAEQMPSQEQLAMLDDALRRLEYYLQVDSLVVETDMLDSVVECMQKLGMHVAA
jgi:hypothetical protein